jgi:hypothetical protein
MQKINSSEKAKKQRIHKKPNMPNKQVERLGWD